MRKNRISLLVIGFICLALVSCSKKKEEDTLVKKAFSQVVPTTSGLTERTVSGITAAAAEVSLSFKVSGTVNKVNVKQGQKVNKGMLLASLDATDLRLEYNREQASLSRSDAELKQAELEFNRKSSLYESNNLNKAELDRVESEYLTAKALRVSAKRNVDLAYKKLTYASLYAPFTGLITSDPIDPPKNINTGEEIMKLSDQSNIDVKIGLGDLFINKVKVGDIASVSFDEHKKQYQARILEKGFSINDSGSYPVTLRMITKDDEIKPGMVCDVNLQLHNQTQIKDTIVIKNTALSLENDKKAYVYVYDEASKTVFKQEVELGEIKNNGIEIISGLNGGEIIITRGVNKLNHGMRVDLLEEGQE